MSAEGKPRIGVLAIQGDVREHIQALERVGCEAAAVRKAQEIEGLGGLIIPGGESTTIGKLIERYGLAEAICGLAERSPIYGTCAGMILVAKDIVGSDQFRLGLMDISVKRNAYGRQVDSFEADVAIPAIGDPPFRAVFIRAPVIVSLGGAVEALAEHDGRVILARQGNILVSSFHPELTTDERIHRYFLQMAAARR
jgi:5'-phosphate synthase pdxT subunit